jgi:DNA repair protein RecN (Recombination protein N)
MDLTAEKTRLSTDAEALAREIDLLTHQVGEIESASLRPDEEEPLVARQRMAANAHRLSEICRELQGIVGESDDSISSRFTDLLRLTREMHRLDPGTESLGTTAAGLFEGLQDFSRDVAHYAEAVDCDPGQLADIEARLDVIQSLKRKYGATIEAVIAFGADAATRLKDLQSREERGAGLDAEIAAAEKALAAAAKTLTKARRAAAPKLAEKVKSHLGDLGFAKAGFSIAFEDLASPSPLGAEQIEFLFAPNPGEPERPLRSIASSGEISRVMLALKTSLAAHASVPVLIFDEIDANVGGEIGAKVGAKMRDLGTSHQVFSITHLPQVAAQASAQFVVTKATTKDRTSTSLVEVCGADREAEIARMLGGKAESAIAHARTLLGAR